jgi:hypothetical protein
MYKPSDKLRNWFQLEKLNSNYFSRNIATIPLPEQHPEKNDRTLLSMNPSAIPLPEQHPEKIDWTLLSMNPLAIPLLQHPPEKINWIYQSKNPEIFGKYDYDAMKESKKHIHEALNRYCKNNNRHLKWV